MPDIPEDTNTPRSTAKDPAAIWQAALGSLQLQVTKPYFDTWLRDTAGLALDGETFSVGTTSLFASEWLRSKLSPLIADTLAKLLHRSVAVDFQIAPLPEGQASAPLLSLPPARQPGRLLKPALNPNYTVASFVFIKNNRLAHAAALTVAQATSFYNPLVIYGGVGLGKTHLLHAFGHEAWARNLAVLYVPTERFTNDFV